MSNDPGANAFTTASGTLPGEPSWQVAHLFPLQGSWTEDDYLALATNRLVELSEGCIEVFPRPAKGHQRIVQFLFLLLHHYLLAKKCGEVFVAPLPVRLWPGKLREPDIVYIESGRAEFRGRPEGADLVIEVVSEGEENRQRDLAIKPLEYARAGVAEYWIVDPQERRVTVLTLEGAEYRLHGAFGAGQVAQSLRLPGFQVIVSQLLAAAEPS